MTRRGIRDEIAVSTPAMSLPSKYDVGSVFRIAADLQAMFSRELFQFPRSNYLTVSVIPVPTAIVSLPFRGGETPPGAGESLGRFLDRFGAGVHWQSLCSTLGAGGPSMQGIALRYS